MKKICIIRTGALGDIIQTYPVIDYLHKKFPEAQIDWIVEPANAVLVQAHPHINKALLVPIRLWKKQPFNRSTWQTTLAFRKQLRETTYDVVFDLQGNFRSGLILSQVRSSNKVGFAWNSVPEWPNLLFTNQKSNPPGGHTSREDYLSIISHFFRETAPIVNDLVTLTITPEQQKTLNLLVKKTISKSESNIMVCPGSAWPNKQLSTNSLVHFLTLIQQAIPSRFLLVWGSAAEKVIAEELHVRLPKNSLLIDRMDLPVLQHFMEMCDRVIAMDSMALHLAATVGTPTFSVFGASSAKKYKPTGDRHKVLQGKCPYGRTFIKRCPILRSCPTGACIRDFTGEQLFERFMDLR